MNEETEYVELEYLGGSSRFHQKHLVFKKSNVPNTLIIERDVYKIETFQWHEKGTRNLSLAAFGFLIGTILGITVSQNPFIGIGAGVVGAALLGWWQDTSIIIFTLLDEDQKITLYARCDKQQFKELSGFL